MQKGNSYTVGRWCDRWFCENRGRWSGSTVGGYRNLIYRHILPGIGSIPLAELTEDTVTSFYDSLRGQGLSARSVWCIHLLLRRCMDEAARDQCVPYNPVRLCREPQAEAYQTTPLRLGQLQRYLNAAEQLGALPSSTQGSPAACGNVNSSPCRGPIFISAAGTSSRDSVCYPSTAERSIFWSGYRKPAAMCSSIPRPERHISSTSSTTSTSGF